MKRETIPLVLTLLFFSGLAVPLFFGIPFTTQRLPLPVSTPFIIPVWEQTLLFMAAFIIKPLYMALSLAIAVMLWRRTEIELTALRRGMILFFLGELACAGNYLIFHDGSLLMEYWHNYGMVCAFALLAYALLEAFDARMVHYTEAGKPCALLPLCGSCYKQHQRSCPLRSLFLYVLVALLVVVAIPLTAPLGSRFMVGSVFGEEVIFGHSLLSQSIEVRFFPAVAAVFLLLSFAVLLFQREKGFNLAKIFFALGISPLAFSVMRFLCFWGYGEHPLWADVWEELTELLLILILLRLALLVRSRAQET